MIKTKVISAFPGTGKSWFFNNQDTFGAKVSDSDSSEFSWIEPGVRHPDFPNNYVQHIMSLIGEVDIIFVSSHEVVRNALKDAGITFTLLYPGIDSRDDYIERFQQRGSPEAFIKLISDNWFNWIDDIQKDPYPFKVELPRGSYISDFLK